MECPSLAWGSQELNALLEAHAQGLARTDSGGLLNSPTWKALLDGDSPLHPDSNHSSTLPLQRPKRGRDAEDGEAAMLSGSEEEPSPVAKRARVAEAAPSALPAAQQVQLQAGQQGEATLLPGICIDFLADVLASEEELLAGFNAEAAAHTGTPLPLPVQQAQGSSLPAVPAVVAASVVAQGAAPGLGPSFPASDAVAQVQLISGGCSLAPGPMVPNHCGPLPFFHGTLMGGKIKPLPPGAVDITGIPSTTVASAGGSARQGAAGTAAATAAGSGKGRKHPHLATKSTKAVPTAGDGVFTSVYRGVTKHKQTGRFEAHFWDASYKRETTVYLGGFGTELEAAMAYDKAALTFLGPGVPLNFPLATYSEFLASCPGKTREGIIGELRRTSVGFARGQSQFRGVTRHHQHGKWEARIGKVDGAKYLYLGTYDSSQEAAQAYDRAAVKLKGRAAVTNFDIANYADILSNPDAYPLDSHGASASAASSSPGGLPSPQLACKASQAQALQKTSQQSSTRAVPSPVQALPGQGVAVASSAGTAAFLAAAAWGAKMQAPGGPVGVMVPQVPVQTQSGLVRPLVAGMPFMAMPLGLAWQVPQQAQTQVQAQQAVQQQQAATAATSHTSPTPSAPPAFPPPMPTNSMLGPNDAVGAAEGLLSVPSIPKLPAIRVRPGASTASAAAATAQPPLLAGQLSSQLSLDLAGLALSPLAASLLSPLGLKRETHAWRDSPAGSGSSRRGSGAFLKEMFQHKDSPLGRAGSAAAAAAMLRDSPLGWLDSGALLRDSPLGRTSQEELLKLFGGDLSVGSTPLKTPGSSSDKVVDVWAALGQWLDTADAAQINSAFAPTSAASERAPHSSGEQAPSH